MPISQCWRGGWGVDQHANYRAFNQMFGEWGMENAFLFFCFLFSGGIHFIEFGFAVN
jgi:hypothetical protein